MFAATENRTNLVSKMFGKLLFNTFRDPLLVKSHQLTEHKNGDIKISINSMQMCCCEIIPLRADDVHISYLMCTTSSLGICIFNPDRVIRTDRESYSYRFRKALSYSGEPKSTSKRSGWTLLEKQRNMKINSTC